MEEAHSGAPHGRAKDENGKKKEHTGNFEPQRSADAAERFEKTRETAAKTCAGLTGGAGAGCCVDRGLIALSACCGSTCGRFAGGESLSRDAACNANSDTEDPPDVFRSHSI